ncbi:MAG: tyrosine-type recombinase/integrase [candidate division Zixibacteria bacterium]|nr:tyrosine-type recombinase/integrase [candidate division Zixibacteria bacterium]
MKSEPQKQKKRAQKRYWIIDESMCLTVREVLKLRSFSNQVRTSGLKEKRFSQVRRWFMIELGLHAGLRVEEMASLKHCNLFIDYTRSSLSFLGKGRKPRLVWVSPLFRQICSLYISYKKRFGYDTSEDAPLLNNLEGLHISKRALQKDFKLMAKLAGLPTRYHIHNLRHTYATFLLKVSNHNYRFVQRQLGHASIKTTQIYATVLESEGREALEKLLRFNEVKPLNGESNENS